MKRPRDLTDVSNAPSESSNSTCVSQDLMDRCLSFVKEVYARFCNEPEKFNRFAVIMRQINDERIKLTRLKDLPEGALPSIKAIFEGHSDLIHKFNTFLPIGHLAIEEDYQQEEEEEEENMSIRRRRVGSYQEAVDFVRRVRTRNDHVYEAFLKIITMHEKGYLEPGEAYNKAINVFRDHDDLIKDFSMFAPVFEAISLPPIEATKGKNDEEPLHEVLGRINIQGFDFRRKVQQRIASKVDYLSFLKQFHCYSSGKIGKSELQRQIGGLIGKHHDLLGQFKFFLKNCESLNEVQEKKVEGKVKMQKLESVKGRDESQGKPILEPDISKRKSCTPSYRLLPKDHTGPSKRTKHETQVLNDCCLSWPLKVQNYSGKSICIDQEELWEEARFEVDVLLGWLESASSYGNELMKGIRIGGQGGIHFRRCIERLYRDHGLDVLGLCDKNPKAVLPSLLARLTQKTRELSTWRENFTKMCDGSHALRH